MKKYILLLVSLVVFSAQLKAEIDPKSVVKKTIESFEAVYSSPDCFRSAELMGKLFAEKVVASTDKQGIQLIRDSFEEFVKNDCLLKNSLKDVDITYYPSFEMDEYLLSVAPILGSKLLKDDPKKIKYDNFIATISDFRNSGKEYYLVQTSIPAELYLLALLMTLLQSTELENILKSDRYFIELYARLDAEETVWFSSRFAECNKLLKMCSSAQWQVEATDFSKIEPDREERVLSAGISTLFLFASAEDKGSVDMSKMLAGSFNRMIELRLSRYPQSFSLINQSWGVIRGLMINGLGYFEELDKYSKNPNNKDVGLKIEEIVGKMKINFIDSFIDSCNKALEA